MKKLYIASAFLALLAGATSCSDNYDIYPEEYSEVLILKNGGEQNLTVYSTENKAAFPITVLKGGHASQATKGTLRPMTTEELTEYAEQLGRPYILVPANCYSFSQDAQTNTAELDFTAQENYLIPNVYVDTDAFKNYLDTSNLPADAIPVIPLVLESTECTVNQNGYQIVIVPSYTEPKLEFTDDLISDQLRCLDLNNGVMTTTVTLPIENRWDITFDIAVDQDAYNSYMSSHSGANYTLVDPSAVTTETYSMPQGTSSVSVSIRFDISKMKLTDIVPLKITNVNVDGLEGHPVTGVMFADTSIPLTAEMLSTNAQEPSEGPIANILDGNIETYFHSAWSVAAETPHYIQINLPKAYSKVMVTYWNRTTSTSNNSLWGLWFYTGTSNSDIAFFQTYAFNTPQALNWADTNSPSVFKVPYDDDTQTELMFTTPQSVFRIANCSSSYGANRDYFCISELSMRGL